MRACDFEVKRRCVTGDASVTLVNGVVTKVEVNAFWCGPRGQPGYSCTIDSTRGEDKEARWSEDGGATIVANASPFNPDSPDRVKLTVGKHVSIDLEEAQSVGRCGAGAELPRAIVIPGAGEDLPGVARRAVSASGDAARRSPRSPGRRDPPTPTRRWR